MSSKWKGVPPLSRSEHTSLRILTSESRLRGIGGEVRRARGRNMVAPRRGQYILKGQAPLFERKSKSEGVKVLICYSAML